MFEDANKRLNKAGGGMLVQSNLDGSRPEYAPKKGHKEQKAKLLNWLNNNKILLTLLILVQQMF